MPWEQTGSGYKTKRGGFVRNPAQYEKLRGKGMSKERAARIVNKADEPYSPKEIKRNLHRGHAASAAGAAGIGTMIGANLAYIGPTSGKVRQAANTLLKPKVSLPISAGIGASGVYAQHQYGRAAYKKTKNSVHRSNEKKKANAVSKLQEARIAITVNKAAEDETERKVKRGIGVAGLVGGAAAAGKGGHKGVTTWNNLGTVRSLRQKGANFAALKSSGKQLAGGAALMTAGGYTAHKFKKKDPVHKELRMKDPIEIMKADALWRRDEDIEKGIFGGLAQGLKRTQTIGPMTRSTQAGFNAGSKVRNAGSRVAGAVKSGAQNFRRGAQTPAGPLAATAPAAMKAGQATARAPGRLVSAVSSRPKTAIGVGAGAAGATGAGGYAGGRNNKPKRPF